MRIRISLLVLMQYLVIYGGMNYLNMQAYKLLAGDQNILFSGSLSLFFFPFFSPALDNLARIFINNKNYNEMYGEKGGGGKVRRKIYMAYKKREGGREEEKFLISFLVINLSQ
jgi:hypothetical protein